VEQTLCLLCVCVCVYVRLATGANRTVVSVFDQAILPGSLMQGNAVKAVRTAGIVMIVIGALFIIGAIAFGAYVRSQPTKTITTTRTTTIVPSSASPLPM